MRHAAMVLLAIVAVALASVPASAGEAVGEAVRGVIRQPPAEEGGEEQPVEGVVIDVETVEGQPVGSATTGPDGTFELVLPGPGRYRSTLDQSTLPDGVALRNPDRATLEFEVREGQQRTLLYPLGEGGAGGGRTGLILGLVGQGLKFGLIIAMTAIGLSLIFGTTGLVNFAHGELVTFGALAAYYFNAAVTGPAWHLIPATIAAVVAGALLGGALERGLFRPLRERGTGLIALLVVTIGLSLVLRNVFLYVFGGRTRPYTEYAVQRAIVAGLAPKDLVVMAIATLILMLVGLALLRTRIGKAIRAVADNRDLAESSGIDVQRVILYVWVGGAALAALGGVFQALDEQVSFQQGFQLLLLMFAGVILGGLGTAFGALVGSLLVGVMIQLSTLVVPVEMKNVIALAVMALVLLVRPQGLLGRAERVG